MRSGVSESCDCALDRPVAMERSGEVYYYHYDERGSVIHLTNEEGHVIQEYRYDTFGRIVLETGAGIPNPFTYTGRQWDPEAGLYHYRARAYDPATGRFLQHDPLISTNPYPYAENNPMNFIDPLGMYSTSVEWGATDVAIIKTTWVYGCDWECEKLWAYDICSKRPVRGAVNPDPYYRRKFIDPIRSCQDYIPHCNEVWSGPCAEACKKFVDQANSNESAIMDCLKRHGCIPDDGKQPVRIGLTKNILVMMFIFNDA